ncbi:MAG: regulatory protein RecX [Wenzhouxiangella sp.]|jgi:regulatory protein|nr:regulatory protein RecX [Wenzhouxiangella sp.]
MVKDRAEASPADLREAALRLLARREHSAQELARKLKRKGWPEPMIEPCVGELAEAGLQSDERFAEGFARSRAEKAYGPVRIKAELAERGIDRSLAVRALGSLEVDWLAQAAKWYGRRYGDVPASDFREKSRRRQALTRRGFDESVIRELID